MEAGSVIIFYYVKDKSGSYLMRYKYKGPSWMQLDSGMHSSLLASHKTTHLKPGLG